MGTGSGEGATPSLSVLGTSRVQKCELKFQICGIFAEFESNAPQLVSYGFRCCILSAYAPECVNPAIQADAARCETKKATTPASDADASALQIHAIHSATRPEGAYMFGFGKKKKEAAAQEASSADVYVAPVTGEYLPLSEVSDPVFSQGVMGDGYAVNPTAGTIVAPVAGTIALIQDTLHAFMLRTENGGEVLVHIGIDTVELGGDGFTKIANVGDKVEAGAPIIEVDWAAIEGRIPSKETMVMITNTAKFNISKDSESRRPVAAGDRVAQATKK